MTTKSTSAKKHLQTTLEVPVLRRKYYAESQSGAKKQKVAWCSNGIPSEILEAMNINAVYVENYATVCASKRLSSAFCQAGERAGFSQDVCGYARILMGYLLGGDETLERPYGGLANPDFLVVNSYSCDSRHGLVCHHAPDFRRPRLRAGFPLSAGRRLYGYRERGLYRVPAQGFCGLPREADRKQA